MPANKQEFDLMGDNIVELSTENEIVKNEKVSYDEKRLKDPNAKLLKARRLMTREEEI